jgi:hypothetical protein
VIQRDCAFMDVRRRLRRAIFSVLCHHLAGECKSGAIWFTLNIEEDVQNMANFAHSGGAQRHATRFLHVTPYRSRMKSDFDPFVCKVIVPVFLFNTCNF